MSKKKTKVVVDITRRDVLNLAGVAAGSTHGNGHRVRPRERRRILNREPVVDGVVVDPREAFNQAQRFSCCS